MKELENLKEMYLDEIKKINKKGELTPADGEAAKKALEAITMIDEICNMDEEGYSERSYRGGSSNRSYGDRSYGDRSYNRSYNNMNSRRYMMPEMEYGSGSYNDGRSYRRGRSATTGRYVSRRNAIADMMIDKLEDLLRDAPDMETREAIECALEKLEQY